MAVDISQVPVEIGDRDESVKRFLEQFSRALTRGDTKVLAACWDVPAYVLSDDGAQAVGSTAEVEELFGGAKEQYNAKGVADTRPEIEDITWLTDKLVSVDVRWPWIADDGHEIGAEHSRYVLRVGNDGELRLHVTMMRGIE